MNQTHATDFIIAGAGTGGLASAIMLGTMGYRVQVLEARKADECHEGAGIQLSANACRVLDALNIRQTVQDQAVAPNYIEICRHDDATTLLRLPAGWLHRLAFGRPYLHAHRADLYEALLHEAQRTRGVRIDFQRELSALRQNDQGVEVDCQDQTQLGAKALIAADGIRSAVAAQCNGGHAQRFSGQYAWRALLPASAIEPWSMPKIVRCYVGPGAHLVLYYLRAQSLVNLVAVVDDPQAPSGLDDWTVADDWARLRQRLAPWHRSVHHLLDQLADTPCYRRALYEQHIPDSLAAGRVTLIGDAAHGSLPSMAQGAAMALEDAWILGRCLQRDSDPARAFLRYSQHRLHRVSTVQKASRRLGQLYHSGDDAHLKQVLKGRAEPQLREAVIRAYRYNALNAKIE